MIGKNRQPLGSRGYQQAKGIGGHNRKTHQNDKAGDSPAVRKLRERIGGIRV
ncbi:MULTISPECIES: hypothetical protein [Halomonas]|uniref:Uncharacterized protein n=1 Tax=Halomonas halophila TaxID=29573 RepID=A0ABQ0U325_9GAMM|nr:MULTISPECIES: hypothetical protein [Halomonas]MDR5890288.1 hypothetical protein [Halomonas salina]WJY05794.1 hypothetical protein QWG60_08670 [Halomonas halophila]GEK72944.1 hypothetical protein HHA04nite_14880 [Halomonas halophila]